MNRKPRPKSGVRSDKAVKSRVAKPDSSQRSPSGNAPATKPRRIGFLDGEIEVPDDFDTMGGADLFTDEARK